MKLNQRLLLCMSVLLASCGQPSIPRSEAGSDRDEHGCITSAGYTWCAATDQCERPWELAELQGFENTESVFNDYCNNTD